MEKKSTLLLRQVICSLFFRPRKAVETVTLGLLCFLFFTSFASAQEQKYSLNFEKAPVKQVLLKLKEKGGISFMYDEAHLAQIPPVTFQVKNASLKEVLDRCFANTGLSYELKNGAVVIRKQKPEKQSTEKKTVTGIVVDESGNPMPGVTIAYQRAGSSQPDFGATTDFDGNFQMTIPEPTGSLIFTFVGYKRFSADVAAGSVFNVSLEPDLKDIQ